jgi:hypothetical protein
MTAQTYHSDDGQLVQERDQDDQDTDLTQPDTSLTAGEAEVASADTDVPADMTMPESAELNETDLDLPADMTMPDSADVGEAESDDEGDADPASDPYGAEPSADLESAAPAVPDYPDFSADSNDAEDMAMADGSPAPPAPVSAPFEAPESADLTSVTASHLAAGTTSAGEPWNEIQALFVDDPRASIERAAGLVDDRVEQFVHSVRDRQHSAQSAWQADGAGTEELRVALQNYRAFWTSLEDLPAHH